MTVDLECQEPEQSLPFPGCWEIWDEQTATRPAKRKEALGTETGSHGAGEACCLSASLPQTQAHVTSRLSRDCGHRAEM